MSPITNLIAAADGPLERVLAAIDEAGPERVAELVADELASRYDPPRVDAADKTVVALQLEHRGATIPYHLIISGTADAAPGTAADADATITQQLAELVCGLLGPRGAPSAATRRLDLREAQAVETFKRPPASFAVVQRLLATVDRPARTDLTELASRHGADKWGVHRYTQHYQHHFEPFRDRPLTILEIGVGGFHHPDKGAASLKMWKHFFPRAVVHGIDLYDKSVLAEQRIHIDQVDQSSPEALRAFADRCGPFDIIIDDGSHISEHVLTSLRTLFPFLRNGGLYVVEDLQTSYWPAFGGSTDSADPATSIGFLKSLVDCLNHEEFDSVPERTGAEYDGAITGLHFYHNMAFIEKGVNIEGGAPGWVRNGMS